MVKTIRIPMGKSSELISVNSPTISVNVSAPAMFTLAIYHMTDRDKIASIDTYNSNTDSVFNIKTKSKYIKFTVNGDSDEGIITLSIINVMLGGSQNDAGMSYPMIIDDRISLYDYMSFPIDINVKNTVITIFGHVDHTIKIILQLSADAVDWYNSNYYLQIDGCVGDDGTDFGYTFPNIVAKYVRFLFESQHDATLTMHVALS